jgi:hypothetical protein
LPQAQIDLVADHDHALLIRLPEGLEYRLRLTWAGAGYPRDVNQALLRARLDRDLVVVAEQLSSGSRDLLEARDINWLTVDGSMRLRVGPIAIERQRPGSRSGQSRSTIDAWTPSLVIVAEHVMVAFRRSGARAIPPLRDLAQRSSFSLGAVSQAVGGLVERGWISTPDRTGARALVEPGLLLDQWAEEAAAAGRRQRQRITTLWGSQEEAMEALQREFSGEIAFSGRLVAQRIAPHSTASRGFSCYLTQTIAREDLSRRLRAIGLASRSSGDDSISLTQVRRGVLSAGERRAGLDLASFERVYADLLAIGGRAEDEARFLRETLIGY